MTRSLRLCEDVQEARDLHRLAFRGDAWPGDDHVYWIAREGSKVVGICSAVDEGERVFLSRAAVTVAAQGRGWQRRMIAKRVLWALTETQAAEVFTYCRRDNLPSLTNLIRAGFRIHVDSPRFYGFTMPLVRRPIP